LVAGVVIIALYIVGSFGIAAVAARKGYSYFGFLAAAFLVFPAALLIILVIPDKSMRVTVGSSIKLRGPVQLESGGAIPAGYCAQVLEVSIIDGVPVVRLVGPDGEDHWVAKRGTAPV
jgi:amino acid transporter